MRGLDTVGLLAIVLGLGSALLLSEATAESDDISVARPGEEPILPIPKSPAVDREKAALGKLLFHDPRLSHDSSMACSSCHVLDRGGDDGNRRSHTSSGKVGALNAPTVFNSVLNFRLGWLGNYKNVENQIEADLYDPNLMNSSWDEVLPKLRADGQYAKAFLELYEEGMTRATVLDALSEFHGSLLTPNARFDRYLRGDEDAITADEKKGYWLFKRLGCISCHQGRNVGGNLFQKVGIFEDYFQTRGDVQEIDFGRFLDTGSERDLFVFRVPSLRNVAVTAPYFHDGSVDRLEDAVRKMAKVQLGETLSDGEVALVALFLRTLTGAYEGEMLEDGLQQDGRAP